MRIYPCRRLFLACLGLVIVLLGGGCTQTDDASRLIGKDNPAPTGGLKIVATLNPYPLSDGYPSPAQLVEVSPYPAPNRTSPTPEAPGFPTPATPPGLPTISPSWATYTHPTLPIQLSYPPDWSGSAERYEGSDGFFEIRVLASPPSVFDQNSTFDKIGTLCVLEANGPKSGVYGAFPPIIDWSEVWPSHGQGNHSFFQEPFVHGCVVLATQSDSLQSGSQSVLFARFPPPWPADQVLEFRSDAAHFESFLGSLRLIGYTSQAENEVYSNSPACQEAPEGEPMAVLRSAGLVITETAVAKADCDPWLNYDGFQARAEQANQSRSDFKQQGVRLQMEVNNQALAPFGFHLAEATYEHYSSLFALYQGETALINYIVHFWPVTINAARDDFLLWLGVLCGEPPIVPAEVRRDGVRQDCSSQFERLDPRDNSLWIGEQIFSYETWQNWQQPSTAHMLARRIIVKRGDEVIFELAVPRRGPMLGARRFWAWEGHWLLEVNNVLVQDGELLNTQLGYDEIFEWHPVNDQPLYFFRDGFEYGLSYAGETLPMHYDDVIHGEFWDDAYSYRIISTLLGTDFYARRDGIWYHVTVASEGAVLGH